MKTGLRQVLDRVTIYLPLIMVGLLTLGSYWLLRSNPAKEEDHPARMVKHEPDYYMNEFSLRTFGAKGQLRSEIYGADARHYPDTDTLEISRIRLKSFDQKGYMIIASADRAIANGDGTEVQLIGQAVVQREYLPRSKADPKRAPVRLSGEFLHAFLDSGQLKSHKPVELQRGQNKIRADSMTLDEIEQTVQLSGRVKGEIRPQNRD